MDVRRSREDGKKDQRSMEFRNLKTEGKRRKDGSLVIRSLVFDLVSNSSKSCFVFQFLLFNVSL